MPSYIELDQNTTFPSASAAGKLVFGVNPSNEVVLVDSNGVTSSFEPIPNIIASSSYSAFAVTSSFALIANKANNSDVALQFSHGSTNPGDAITYYIGNVPDLGASTSDTAGRRLTSPVNGVIDYVTIISNVGGTIATNESSSFTVNNITTGASSSVATDFQYNASVRLSTYTNFTPLPVTASDEIQVRWTTPTWVTNPTTVRQNFIVKITVA